MRQYKDKPVHVTKVALTGGAQELWASPPELDDLVRVTIEGRVTGVDYRVNNTTGDLEEIVRIKVVEVDGVRVLAGGGASNVTVMTAADPDDSDDEDVA